MIESLENFLKNFRLTNEEFEAANISWGDLIAIRADFQLQHRSLQSTANAIATTLQSFGKVHSVRSRVKDPNHLLEKIVRKRRENPKRQITIENYKTEITDLIGARALHLFKADWEDIHGDVSKTWLLKEKPIAYIRKGDDTTLFKAQKLTPKEHKATYRSVHYVLKTNVTVETHFVELQVRTILEEAWGEIDHQVRYPYFTDDPLLELYCRLLNGMTGNADEMASLILKQQEFQNRLAEMQSKQAESEQTLAQKQQEVEELTQRYEMVDADKRRLSKILERNARLSELEERLEMHTKIFEEQAKTNIQEPFQKWSTRLNQAPSAAAIASVAFGSALSAEFQQNEGKGRKPKKEKAEDKEGK